MQAAQFTAAMFSRRPHNSKVEAELRRWLLAQPPECRMAFVKDLWQTNYPFALILTQAMQLSKSQIEELLRHWLRASNHNASAELIRRMEPMVGAHKFWRIAREEPLSEAMRDFMNYHSHGRLDADPNGALSKQKAENE